MSEKRHKMEFGDFQTPLPLAEAVCALLRRQDFRPRTVIEPTCGKGSFLESAARCFGNEVAYYGFEINPAYADEARQRTTGVQIAVQDFFTFDWKAFLQNKAEPILFLGNPPWITSSALGTLGAENLPRKTNLKALGGLDARTGKANFDISEWMLLKLIEAAGTHDYSLAMLCKTNVARKVLAQQWKHRLASRKSVLYQIDAAAWFDAAVSASLFVQRPSCSNSAERSALLYSGLEATTPLSRFGIVDGQMVSQVDEYQQLKHLSGVSYYRWRSGIKHDLAKVLELHTVNGRFVNGFGETADIEQTQVFPLLKSSDISRGVFIPTKHLLVPQSAVGADTGILQNTSPRTWRYLQRYANLFAARKSSIYRGQSPFSLFGIGPYSFAPFKVAISGLHKVFRFTLIPPHAGKPVMLDDTCYFIGTANPDEACLLTELLDSEVTQRFLRASVFSDSMRAVTAEVLNRLDLKKIAEQLGKAEEIEAFLGRGSAEQHGQAALVFEQARRYTAVPGRD